MLIFVESTPNDNALKFVLEHKNYVFAKPVYIEDIETAKRLSPLAEELFLINGVMGVFFGNKFITLTKDSETSWDEIRPIAVSRISDYLSKNGSIFNSCNKDSEEDDSTTKQAHVSEIEMQIQEVIKTRIQPAIAMDGGDINYLYFEDGIVYVELRGACNGCPSAAITLKSGIERTLKHFIPEVIGVESK